MKSQNADVVLVLVYSMKQLTFPIKAYWVNSYFGCYAAYLDAYEVELTGQTNETTFTGKIIQPIFTLSENEREQTNIFHKDRLVYDTRSLQQKIDKEIETGKQFYSERIKNNIKATGGLISQLSYLSERYGILNNFLELLKSKKA